MLYSNYKYSLSKGVELPSSQLLITDVSHNSSFGEPDLLLSHNLMIEWNKTISKFKDFRFLSTTITLERQKNREDSCRSGRYPITSEKTSGFGPL